MELTIRISREQYNNMTAALINAEFDAWDRSLESKNERGRKIGERDEIACKELRRALECAFDEIAPWLNERRCY